MTGSGKLTTHHTLECRICAAHLDVQVFRKAGAIERAEGLDWQRDVAGHWHCPACAALVLMPPPLVGREA